MAELVIVEGPHRGRHFKIQEGEILVGRDASNQLQLVDEKVSRQHFKIQRETHSCVITDLSSRNGTFVNGIPLKNAKELLPGDEIVVGDSVILFSDDTSQDVEEEIELIPQEETRITRDYVLEPGDPSFLATGEQDPDALHKANEYLFALYEASRAINVIQELPKLFDRILELVFKIIPADRGAIIFINPETQELVPKAVRNRDSAHDSSSGDVAISRSIVRQVLERGDAVLCSDVAADPRFRNEESIIAHQIRSAIYVPLRGREKILGVLLIDSMYSRADFNQEKVRLLSALGNIAGIAIENSRFHEDLRRQNADLKNALILKHQIVGKSASMEKVLDMIARVAPTDSTVLIRGESGTGKELVAKAIHYNSLRKDKVWVGVNCAALAPGLVESELFGHERGAFTTAIHKNIGRFEQANEGTLFLDEIGELPLEIQVKLLRVLEEREFQRVGGSKTIKCNVRLVAATNRDLEEAVKKNEFREDLYYRLQVIQIMLPPIRERVEDIAILTKYFLSKFNKEIGRTFKKVSAEAIELMKRYPWPGNIRELRNALERAVVLGSGDTLLPEHLPLNIHRGDVFSMKEPSSKPLSLKEMEKQHIVDVLTYTKWNKKSAAQLLGIDRSTLYEKLKVYDIRP